MKMSFSTYQKLFPEKLLRETQVEVREKERRQEHSAAIRWMKIIKNDKALQVVAEQEELDEIPDEEIEYDMPQVQYGSFLDLALYGPPMDDEFKDFLEYCKTLPQKKTKTHTHYGVDCVQPNCHDREFADTVPDIL